MGVRQVTVMADYGAFPLWGGKNGGMLLPDALPLSDGLRDELIRWSDDYDRILRTNGYEWPSEQVMTAWNRRGLGLARRVARELGASYQVVFFDEPNGRVIEL